MLSLDPKSSERQKHVNCSSVSSVVVKGKAQSAKPALLGPMSSDGARISTYALEAEPYSSATMRPGVVKAVLHLVRRVPCCGGLPERHGDVTKRPRDAPARLHAATWAFG